MHLWENAHQIKARICQQGETELKFQQCFKLIVFSTYLSEKIGPVEDQQPNLIQIGLKKKKKTLITSCYADGS